MLLWIGSIAAMAAMNRGAAFGLYVVSTAFYGAFRVYAAGTSLYSIKSYGALRSILERADNVAFAILIFALMIFHLREGILKARFLLGSMALFLLLVIATIFLSGAPSQYTFPIFMRSYGQPFLFFILFTVFPWTRREVRTFFGIMIGLGFYMSGVSILEFLGFYSAIVPPWVGDITVNTMLGGGRSGGLLMQSEWNGFALNLLSCLLLRSISMYPNGRFIKGCFCAVFPDGHFLYLHKSDLVCLYHYVVFGVYESFLFGSQESVYEVRCRDLYGLFFLHFLHHLS